MRIFYCFISILVLSVTTLTAQEEKWDGGFFLGGSNYVGDLQGADGFDLGETNVAFGFMLRRNISNTFGVRLGLTTGKLTGSDMDSEFI